MRRTYIKTMAAVLAGLMVVQGVLTGCGKKNIDYHTGENSGSNNQISSSDEGGIRGRLGIPESCNESIDVGNSGVGTISIVDENISVPNTDKMDVVHFTPMKTIENDYKKQITEKLLEKEKGIYAYDYEHRTKADIQADIEGYRKQKETADEGYMEVLEEEIKKLEAELEAAPDAYPAAGNYEADAFLGMVEDVRYMVDFDCYDKRDDAVNIGVGIFFSPNNEFIKVRPYENAVGGYWYENEGEHDSVENKTAMTAEEAEDIANNFLSELEINDVSCISTNDLMWHYYDESDDSVTECDGYSVRFMREICGAPAYSGSLHNIENLQMIGALFEIPREYFCVSVYDGRVIGADWSIVYNKEERVDENVELLSYEQILEKANTEIGKYYEKYPTQYKNIEFNDVRLTYFVVSDGEDKCKYIPVWVFAQYEEYVDSDGSDMPKQLVLLNAMDGSFVDIIEEAKSIGTYMDFSGGGM